MTRVIVEDAFASQLDSCTSTVEVCDVSGKVLGMYFPASEAEVAGYADIESPFSEDEIRRRVTSPGGSTLAEIWKRLEQR